MHLLIRHRIPQNANPVNFNHNFVAGTQLSWRRPSQTDAARRAGADYVTQL
jgi:hypothetical protein